MRRGFLILIAVLGVAAIQPPPDESNVPESEKRIPPGHYCKRADVPIGRTETRAHHCDCTFSCTVDDHGAMVEHESPACLAFCHVNNRRCTCHVEEPCPASNHGNARMDMDGRVVSVRVR